MATAIHREAIVGPDGKIEISAPELIPGQHVSISIEPIEPIEQHTHDKPHALDLLERMPGHRLFKSAEEVDTYLREERDSWDR